jgi:2-dehydro-3-deoxyglucarate aldolase
MTSPYTAFPNRFRTDLRAGKTLIGLWSSLASPISTEVCGLAGFDWMLLDGEHSPNDVHTFVPQLMALKDSPTAPVVRPSWNNPVEIKRLLDAGFYNFIVPFIENADAARAAVAATRYPPQGMRGVSISQRSNRYGTVEGYWEQANDQMCVIAQIENRAGVAAAGEIAAVDGVDCLFCGPSDLSAAFGHLAKPQHPEVQDAIREVIALAKSHGKPTGILAPIEDDARRYLEMGATLVAVGSDLGLLRMGTKALRERFRPG